jgi:hypothetical protein
MPGQPTFSVASSYSGQDVPGARQTPGTPSNMAFVVWVAILGVLLPIVILGGLNVGGFKFVFRGRG